MSGIPHSPEEIIESFLKIQQRLKLPDAMCEDGLEELMTEFNKLISSMKCSVASWRDSGERGDPIETLREFLNTAAAAFKSADGAEKRTRTIRAFTGALINVSKLCEELRLKNETETQTKVTVCVMEGIRSLRKLTAIPFVDATAVQLSDVCSSFIGLCEAVLPVGIRLHVGVVKIFAEFVMSCEPQPSIGASMVDMNAHLMRVLVESLRTPEKRLELPPGAVKFYYKRILEFMRAGSFSEGQNEPLIEFAATLRHLQVSSDFAASVGLNDIDDLWTLAKQWRPVVAVNGERRIPGPGHILLICDFLEINMDLLPDEVVLFLRSLLDSTDLIANHMFLWVGGRSLFDQAVRAFCFGVSRLETFDLEKEILSAAMELRFSTKQIFCSEVLRCLSTIWPESFGVYSELFRESEPSGIGKIPFDFKQKDTLSKFLHRHLTEPTVSQEYARDLVRVVCSIHPCNATSALLLSLLSTELSRHLQALSIAELTDVFNHQLVVLEDNLHNDCLIITACIVLSYIGNVSFKDVVDVRPQMAVRKIAEKILKSGRKLGTVFGLTTLLCLAKSFDHARMLSTMTKNVSEDLLNILQGDIDPTKWAEVVEALVRGTPEGKEPLVNEYFKVKPRSERTGEKSIVETHQVSTKKENTVKDLCQLVFGLEKKMHFSQEDRALMKVCIEKLRLLADK